MKLIIGAVGRIKPGPEASLVDDYIKRFDGAGRSIGLGPLTVEEFDARGKGQSEESALLAGRIAADDQVIILDERGKSYPSKDFSNLICGWRDDGVRCARFLIGGADGHTSELRKRANTLISFGSATWPHMMVRAMLAEQLYRAAAIATNHPYHRGN